MGEYRIFTNGSLKRGPKKVRLAQTDTAQITLHDSRFVEIDPTEVHTAKIGAAQVWLNVKVTCAPVIPYRHALPQDGNVILIPGRDSLPQTGP